MPLCAAKAEPLLRGVFWSSHLRCYQVGDNNIMRSALRQRSVVGLKLFRHSRRARFCWVTQNQAEALRLSNNGHRYLWPPFEKRKYMYCKEHDGRPLHAARSACFRWCRNVPEDLSSLAGIPPKLLSCLALEVDAPKHEAPQSAKEKLQCICMMQGVM